MEIEPLIGWEAFFIGFFVLLIVVRLGAELIERKARRTRQRQTGRNVPKAVQRYYNTYRKGA